MKKITIGIMAASVIVTIGQLALINYSDLSWSKNAGSYLGITSTILLIIFITYSNRYEKKNQKE